MVNLLLIKAFVVSVFLAFGEVLNGNIRVRLLHRIYGKKRAKKISFFSGLVVIFLITWFSLPWISPNNYLDCFKVGFIWLCVIFCLDIYFGRFIFKLKWNRIADDFNLMKGNLIGLGMILLFITPSFVYWCQI